MRFRLRRSIVFAALALLAPALRAWNYEGHRMVSQLALASLPRDFPAFVQGLANAERVAFLSGEPDRWRNVPDLPLKQSGGSWTDHFCDLEYIPAAGLDVATLPSFRYDFIVQFAAGRAAHADRFPAIDPAKNIDHTAEWPGFAPWAMTEGFGRLRSTFSYLKVYEELGTEDEIANARANVLYAMGVLGHYIGDSAQPLHTTKHHNGWVGDNPHGYSTVKGIHAWIDGGLIARTGINTAELLPRVARVEPLSLAPRPDARDPFFVAALAYLVAQHAQVEAIYQLEQSGQLGFREGQTVAPEARAFIQERLLAGSRMLAQAWLTAYRSAVPDTYLRAALLRRQASAEAAQPAR